MIVSVPIWDRAKSSQLGRGAEEWRVAIRRTGDPQTILRQMRSAEGFRSTANDRGVARRFLESLSIWKEGQTVVLIESVMLQFVTLQRHALLYCCCCCWTRREGRRELVG